MKSNEVRKKIAKELRKMPIVSLVCKKVGIGRATFYRWKKVDKKFAEHIDEAIQEGAFLINDMAESVLIHKIRDGDVSIAKFWLRHHHPAYSDKTKVAELVKPIDTGKLTPRESLLIKKAIELDFGRKIE